MADDKINELLNENVELRKELNDLIAQGKGNTNEADRIRKIIKENQRELAELRATRKSSEEMTEKTNNEIGEGETSKTSKTKGPSKTSQAWNAAKPHVFGAANWTSDALTKGVGSNFSQIMIGIILILAFITYFVTQSYIAIVGAIGLMIIFLLLPKLLENQMIKAALIFGGLFLIIMSLLFFKQITIFVITILALLFFFAPMLKSDSGRAIALAFIAIMLVAVIALPTLTSDILAKGIAFGTYATSQENTNKTTKNIINSIKDFFTNLQKQKEIQMQIIAGNYSEGNMQQTQNPYGIKILPPRDIINPDVTNINQPTEVYASLYGYSTQNMQVTFACSITKSGEENLKTTGDIFPESITFDANLRDIKDGVTCKFTPIQAGTNEVTIEAIANNIETSAELENYFIDKETYLTKKRVYEDQHNIILETNDEAMSALFSGYKKAISMSEAGHLKLIIATNANPVIPIDDKTFLTIILRFENTEDGLITGVNYIKLKLPEGFKPSPNCLEAGWAQEKDELVFSQSKLSIYDFTNIKKGMQTGVPSCQIQIDNKNKILINPTQPNLAKFKAKISYNYKVALKKEIKVLETEQYPPISYGSGKVNPDLGHVDVQEKILAKASEMGIPGSLALAVAYYESNFDQDKVNTNPTSKDYGVMQVNNRHCEYFNPSDRANDCFKKGTVTTICDAKNDVDCNIMAGLKILKDARTTCLGFGGTIQYCGGQYTYSDWDCALRLYNGWSSATSCENPQYVNMVKSHVPKFT